MQNLTTEVPQRSFRTTLGSGSLQPELTGGMIATSSFSSITMLLVSESSLVGTSTYSRFRVTRLCLRTSAVMPGYRCSSVLKRLAKGNGAGSISSLLPAVELAAAKYRILKWPEDGFDIVHESRTFGNWDVSFLSAGERDDSQRKCVSCQRSW